MGRFCITVLGSILPLNHNDSTGTKYSTEIETNPNLNVILFVLKRTVKRDFRNAENTSYRLIADLFVIFRWIRKSRWKSFQAVFGRFSLEWFSPFTKLPIPSKPHGYMFSV
jgi:hypothetical protein